MILQACCICLDSTQLLKKLGSGDNSNIKLLIKLNNIAPEQKWLDVFSICTGCDLQLDNAYHFKKLCLKNDKHRRGFSQQIATSDCLRSEDDLKDEIKLEDTSENFKEGKQVYSDSKILLGLLDEESKNKIFICFHCNKRFKSKPTLERHLNDQHSNICVQCSKIFNTKKGLRIHMKNDHQHNHVCGHCSKVFITRQYLRIHMKNDHGNIKSTKFQCEICGEYFSLLKNILEHCSTVHSLNPKNVKPYWCTQCKNKFSSSTLLLQHTKYHNGNRTYVCSICGKSFITKRDLSGHEKLHYNQRKYCCNKCNKSFNTSQNLKTHIYVVHTDPNEWKYSCPVCLKRFAMRANFNEHVKRHQGNKDYSCHICKKMFVSRHELKKHIKLHSNIAPYKCSQCHKNYRDKRSLDLHLSKAHSVGIVKNPVRVKKFVCHVCPSQFFDNHKLQRHIRSHTGVKPYACHGCDKRFGDKYYLLNHLKNVHNIKDTLKVENYNINWEDNF